MSNQRTGGVIIGRFMPPHTGHRYLIDFARNYLAQTGGELTVFVCTLHDEPIPGALRCRWMQELCPGVRIVHITEEIPEASRAAKGAQDIWADAIVHRLETPPAYVFASEEYGVDLAASLGARFVPVDPQRSLFPISAGQIRSNPLAHWDFIPAVVRPYFVVRVSVVSGDYAAAHSLAHSLADRYHTVCAGDYRRYREQLSYAAPAITEPADVLAAQISAIRSLAPQADRVIFLESDIIGSILSSGDQTLRDRLAEGTYEGLIEELAPHLVLAIPPVDPEYLAVAAARGWVVRELGSAETGREPEAARLIDGIFQGSESL